MGKSQLEPLLIELLKKQCLQFNEKNNYFEMEVYAGSNDELSDKQIKKVLQHKNPQEYLIEMVNEEYGDNDYLEYDEIIRQLKQKLDSDIFDEHKEYIEDWVKEHVCLNYPYEHYLNQEINVDIIVDTGDGNEDFVLNCVYPHYNGRKGETISDKASIVWLTKQQGYTKTQLNKAMRYSEYGGSKFLKSIRDEVANCTSHMNALAFFVQLTLKDYFELVERKSKNLIISQGMSCGLYDCWNGAGGSLEIELDKDVVLPKKFISSMQIDGARGYSVDEIYGVSSKFWKGKIVA